jgi:hypothetical protein
MGGCMWGTFDRQYPRNQIIYQGLKENGVELVLYHEPVWQHSEDKTKSYKSLIGKLKLIFSLIWAPGLIIESQL